MLRIAIPWWTLESLPHRWAALPVICPNAWWEIKLKTKNLPARNISPQSPERKKPVLLWRQCEIAPEKQAETSLFCVAAAAAAKSLRSVRLCATPQTAKWVKRLRVTWFCPVQSGDISGSSLPRRPGGGPLSFLMITF